MYYSIYRRRFAVGGVPTVSTIHDMIVERFPTLFGPEWNDERAAKARAIRGSASCIAISECTKRDRGIARAATFSWERTVRETVDSYRRAVA